LWLVRARRRLFERDVYDTQIVMKKLHATLTFNWMLTELRPRINYNGELGDDRHFDNSNK